MKRYKLLKDLPTFKAGDTFMLTGAGDLILEKPEPPHTAIVYAYNHTTLQKFPNILEDWFEELPEPLIKDEKIRKAVRAWAEANNLSSANIYKTCLGAHYWYIRMFDDSERGIDIEIWGKLPRELVDCKCYTLEELCGDEYETEE